MERDPYVDQLSFYRGLGYGVMFAAPIWAAIVIIVMWPW